MLDILKHLTSTPGPAGSENKVAELLQTYIKKLGLNSHIDNMGNLVATIKGKNPDKSIAIVVHTDELDCRLRQYQRASGRLRMGETNQRGRRR